jgi:hypothetical protein
LSLTQEPGVARHRSAAYLDGDIVSIGTGMTTFDNREQAFENMFAREQEMLFKVHARRDKLLGKWAAQLMGLTQAEAEAYGRELVHSDFEMSGDEDIVKKLLGDFTGAGIEIDEAAIRAQIEEKTVEARRQLMEAQD